MISRTLLLSCAAWLFTGGTPFSVPMQARAQTAGPITTFEVHNIRGPSEISEVSQLYVDNRLVAVFHIDLAHSDITRTVTLPANHTNAHYVLCGEITIMRHGKQETRAIHGTGYLHDPGGHSLEAVGTQDFTEFFLVDYDDPGVATHVKEQTGACPTANS